MATSKPAYRDVVKDIPRVNEGSIKRRALSELEHQVAHYEAGSNVSANLTPANELAHLQSVARFHHGRDFGGATGRTLEYTYAILPSGRIYLINPETFVTWSHKNGNRVGMATLLCLGRGQEPTPAMLATLTQHWDYCAERADLNIDRRRSWGHGETGKNGPGPNWGNATPCPEKALPFVKQYRQGATPVPVPNEPQNPDKNGWFEVTKYSIGGAIGAYWHLEGGVSTFGYPLSGEQSGSSYPWLLMSELKGFTVQRFEYETLGWKASVGVVRVRIGVLVDELVEDGQHAAV